MNLELINTLSESKIFRSKDYLSKYSPEDVASLFYLYVLSVYMLDLNDSTEQWADDYMSKTIAFGNFNSFRTAGTDLYMFAHLLSDNKFFNENEFKRFLFNLRHNNAVNFYMYLGRLENQLKIRNPLYKNIKRTFANWDTISDSKQKQAIGSLYREIYKIAPVAEILNPIQQAKHG